MDFDVVIGNPPYNNDLYLDFVQAGYEALKPDGVMVMITPAKWQAKNTEENECFRNGGSFVRKKTVVNYNAMVPHIKEIVYYPDNREIFSIKMQGGCAYYSIYKGETFGVKTITNVCTKNKNLNGTVAREFDTSSSARTSKLLNAGVDILRKTDVTTLSIKCNGNRKFRVYALSAYMNGAIMLESGDTLLLSKMHVEDKDCDKHGVSEEIIYESDSKDECESFISYIQSRLMRFLAYIIVAYQGPKYDEILSFLPDPGAFDHIFTDAELYQKCGLTQGEINIIESVIKERKCENSVP